MPSALAAWSLNHWTAREVPWACSLNPEVLSSHPPVSSSSLSLPVPAPPFGHAPAVTEDSFPRLASFSAPQPLPSPWATQTSPGRPCGPLLHGCLLHSSSVTFVLEPTTSDVINLTITLLNSLPSSSCA